jgi:hypothetical protein
MCSWLPVGPVRDVMSRMDFYKKVGLKVKLVLKPMLTRSQTSPQFICCRASLSLFMML